MKSTLSVSALCALAVLSQASAATFTTSAPANGAATGDYNIAFQAAGGATVWALGAYNSGGGGSLTDPLTVSLWQFGGSLLASTTISGSGDGSIGSFVYNNVVTPVALTDGSFYTLSVQGFTAGTPYNNVTAGTFNGALNSIVLGGVGFGPGGTFNDNPPFAAGDFSTVPFAPVPEPETYAMLAGLGLVGFGLYRRCRN